MIKYLLLAFLAFVQSAFAQTAPDIYYFSNTSPVNQFDSTLSGVCAKAVSYLATKNGTTATYVGTRPIGTSTTDFYCQAKNASGATIDYASGFKRTCPSTTPRWDPNQLKCVLTVAPPPPSCGYPNGSPIRFSLWRGHSALNSNDALDVPPYPDKTPDCGLKGVPDVEACYSVVREGEKRYYCIYNGISDGSPAVWPGDANGQRAPEGPPADNPEREPMPPTPAPPGSSQCPKGSVMAGYNSSGTPMCVGTGTLPSNTPAAPPKATTSNTVSNADGSTTTTTTTTTTNIDGSQTIVKQIVTNPAPGSGGASTSSETRETTKTPSGAAGTETKPEQVNFCKQNPTLSICRESSVSGTCGEVACMGDAIQCATLRAAAAMECKQRADEEALKASPLHALGAAAAAGNDPMAGSLPTVKNATTVAVPTMAASGWIGGGSAFRDVSFTVQGRTFTLPLERWTGYLVGLRYALMVVAMLVSFRMLSGVILRD